MLLQERIKEKIVLKPKMAVPKKDLIKIDNSKYIRQSYMTKKRRRRQEKVTRHSPSK